MVDETQQQQWAGVFRSRPGMIGLLIMLVYSSTETLKTEAFVPPFSVSGTRTRNSEMVQLEPLKKNVATQVILRSTASSQSSSLLAFGSLKEFNSHLEKFVEKCGSMNEPVIQRAAECQDLWEKAKEGEGNFEPDEISFQFVLSAWSQCTQTLVRSRRNRQTLPSQSGSNKLTVEVYTPLDAAKRATTLLLSCPEPNLDAYNTVIDAWSKSRVPEAPEAAERLLKRMMDDESVEPNTNSYNLLIDAWANSNKPNSLDKSMQIYRHMQGLSRDETKKNVQPTIRTVNAVLHAYARKSAQYTSQNDQAGFDEAAKCAAASLNLLEETKRRYKETGDVNWQPDMATYTSVMDVHSRCATYRTTKMAGELLNELKELHAKTGNYRHKPNFRTYTTLVTAWSRTKSDESPQRVEAIMKEMKRSGEKPNARTYTAAVQCWARARDPLKAKRVLKLLMEMREEYKKTGSDHIRPTTLTYNNAIDACARCQGSPDQKTESVKIAFAILKTIEMDEDISPDGVTYSTLIRALNFLMPSGDERNQVAKAVFEKAKKAGLIELVTLKNLRLVLDSESMRAALEGNLDQNGDFNYSSLPSAWKKNAN
mmetsp:Transcript_54716/g.111808  ORF Transcript_54716/g.111808 Transcript_54716/m.111808 type:complete len:595 (-) Transcript_54716:584-2368(-)|eukprot:CAMPEP_0201212774 /NCGR_PEP_ID=MMETSP0851-20130426/184813_1 /ASSEMBLY_ACC=CAM_ASM_000631 /TAXON_ID=183588 /ORGANISM="Pseudo-nitzschia fraudulenta, Strain WWA7" /LENGTH=594 /DNA_ID=CAMNT_0047501867 /DNA_START=189 /DNA_END=1973 /DNA_ORIENTATION=-